MSIESRIVLDSIATSVLKRETHSLSEYDITFDENNKEYEEYSYAELCDEFIMILYKAASMIFEKRCKFGDFALIGKDGLKMLSQCGKPRFAENSNNSDEIELKFIGSIDYKISVFSSNLVKDDEFIVCCCDEHNNQLYMVKGNIIKREAKEHDIEKKEIAKRLYKIIDDGRGKMSFFKTCASHIEYLCKKYEETKDDSFIENILGLVRGYDKASQKFIQVFRDLDQLWMDIEGSNKK